MSHHPCTWLVKQAKAKVGQTKSNAVRLPMGPGHRDMTISTVAFKKLMAFSDCSVDYAYQLLKIKAGAIADAYLKALKKYPNIVDISGISEDSKITMEHWYANYETAIKDYGTEMPKTLPLKSEEDKPAHIDIKLNMVRNAFATQAMAALIKDHHGMFVDKASLSKEAFEYADAMMEAM